MQPVVAVVSSMLLVVVAMGAAWFATREQRDDAGRGSPSTTPTTSTTSTTEPESLEAVVAELSDFVERQRGLEFERPVDVELLDDREFERRLLDGFEAQDEADVRDTAAELRALGLLEAGDDLVAQVKAFLSAGVVGSYDQETDELIVRGTELSPYARQTLAHELTHALDDQHFELFRPELDETDDERSFGFSALVEGNATTVGNAYRDSLGQDEQAQLEREEAAIGADTDFGQFPQILLALFSAPYELGPPFIDALVADGGQRAIDAAFDGPPVSSEQVLDPQRYLDDEGPVTVAEPPADGESFDQGTFGQLLLLLLLSDGGVATETAQQAAIGWGGDRYVAWHEGARACLRVAFVGDTPTDTDELERGLAAWADGRDDAAVRRDGDRAVLTSCG